VLYSPHGRDQLTLLERAFEHRRPDIDVRWLDMGSQEILDRLRFERVNPQADVWFGGPSSIFDQGIRDSLLVSYRPKWADRVDPRAVGRNDLYFPVYRTPAVIAFNSRAVSRAEAPRDWDEILEPKWNNKVLIRDPMASGTMRAIWFVACARPETRLRAWPGCGAWMDRPRRTPSTQRSCMRSLPARKGW
jgi:iron(III) transport system substrate-binding protein